MPDPGASLLQTPFSVFLRTGGMRWHVQRAGQGPVLLLLHGTASSSHAWRGMFRSLAEDWCVIAPDLPGHGLSSDPGIGGLSLPGMARQLRGLLSTLEVVPEVMVGHSAGAALAARLCLDSGHSPRCLTAVNGALLPPLGMPLHLFSPLAKLLAATPLIPEIFSRRARGAEAVRRLLETTGSRLDPHMIAVYQTLLGESAHVSAALRMMAWWDLPALARDLPRLRVPLDLLVAAGDRTIPPAEASRVQALLPHAQKITLPGLGHLAHEEDPAACLRTMRACWSRHEPQECTA